MTAQKETFNYASYIKDHLKYAYANVVSTVPRTLLMIVSTSAFAVYGVMSLATHFNAFTPVEYQMDHRAIAPAYAAEVQAKIEKLPLLQQKIAFLEERAIKAMPDNPAEFRGLRQEKQRMMLELYDQTDTVMADMYTNPNMTETAMGDYLGQMQNYELSTPVFQISEYIDPAGLKECRSATHRTPNFMQYASNIERCMKQSSMEYKDAEKKMATAGVSILSLFVSAPVFLGLLWRQERWAQKPKRENYRRQPKSQPGV